MRAPLPMPLRTAAEVAGSPDAVTQAWEAAYLRFETPRDEVRKFRKRLLDLEVDTLPKGTRALELCCGRGNGLSTLRGLGFTDVIGLDLSGELLTEATRLAGCVQADARQMPLATSSRDLVVVQGGLHHIPAFPDGLDEVLGETARVLAPGGRFVVVEPWLTPFLSLAYWSALRPTRRLWSKLDALGAMVELEWDTLEPWLRGAAPAQAALARHFETERLEIGWGQLAGVFRPSVRAAR